MLTREDETWGQCITTLGNVITVTHKDRDGTRIVLREHERGMSKTLFVKEGKFHKAVHHTVRRFEA